MPSFVQTWIEAPFTTEPYKQSDPDTVPALKQKLSAFRTKRGTKFFVEPCGLHTEELYLQGLSSSLPEEVQVQMLHTIRA